MSMSVGPASGEAEVMVEMNTTPLIDVMLVLLIMLILTIPPQTHAVKIDMPRPNPNQQNQEPPEVVDLMIDFDGTVTWNGNTVSNEGQLANYFRDAAEKAVQPEIRVRPNRLSHYNTTARVLGIAQRLGVHKIGIVGNEQYL